MLSEQPQPPKKPESQPFQIAECQCCIDRMRELGEEPVKKIALPEHTLNQDATVLVCPNCDAIKV